MEQQLLSRLHQHLAARDFSSVIALSEAALRDNPGDLTALYCGGVALVFSQVPREGAACLRRIVTAFDEQKRSLPEQGWRLTGDIAIQLARIAEHHRFEGFETCCAVGARTAVVVGEEVGDPGLAREGAGILERYWTCSDRPDAPGYLRPPSPNVLQVEPTNRCNLRCTMCPRQHMTRPMGSLDVGLFREILSGWGRPTRDLRITHTFHRITLIEQKPRGVKLYFMGEPLLHPRVHELVAIARAAGYRIGVQTNGLLLSSPEIRRRLLEARPSEISVSIDGFSAASYEAVRAGSTWDRIVTGVAALHREREEMGLTEAVGLEVATILVEDSAAFRQRLREFLGPIAPLVRDVQLLPLSRKFDAAFCDMAGDLEERPREDEPPAPDDGAMLCSEPLTKLNVLWNGDVTPCCFDINGSHVLGSTTRSTIDEIWNGPRTLELHRALVDRDLARVPLCRRCVEGR